MIPDGTYLIIIAMFISLYSDVLQDISTLSRAAIISLTQPFTDVFIVIKLEKVNVVIIFVHNSQRIKSVNLYMLKITSL